jgi:ATP-dependent Clp protease ATP-binding subunit ClpA
MEAIPTILRGTIMRVNITLILAAMVLGVSLRAEATPKQVTVPTRSVTLPIERFTESARRVLFFARSDVSQYGGARLEIEHVLLGVLQEIGATIELLLAPDWSLQRIRDRLIESLPASPRLATSIEIPFSPASKMILQGAANEADDLGDQNIRPEHILLALLADMGDSGQLLRQAGMTRESILNVLKGQ